MTVEKIESIEKQPVGSTKSEVEAGSISTGSQGEICDTDNTDIVLVPRPSSDPRDPLNWSKFRKWKVTATLCLAIFVGVGAALCGQLNLGQQAELYGRDLVEISYFNSAASAGFAFGGFVAWPMSRKFGRTSVVFWSLVAVLGCQIWAPLMTSPNDYIPYLLSRLFAGLFGTMAVIMGPRYLVDMFFLHQRGRAFTIMHVALNFGGSAGPTFSAFIAAHGYWPTEYWWSIALTGVTIILVFLFLEETTFDRENLDNNRPEPSSWVKGRVDTVFPGSKVAVGGSWKEIAVLAITPLKLMLAPVIIIIAGFDMVGFGFYIALNSLTPVWLQTPKAQGGVYGFSVTETAAFSFIHWIGFAVAMVYGHFVSDRIPLWFTKRNGGNWKPEYRLQALWPTNFFLVPVGLGLVGACMEYRLHWAVMAVAQFLVTLGSMISIPVTVNYIVECFRSHTVEATLAINSMRLFLGFGINFYIKPWIAAVGIGWVYGMMAFFSVFSFCFLIALMIWGHQIRGITPFLKSTSEEGAHVFKAAPRSSSEAV